MKRPLSTEEITKTEIFRFFNFFSKTGDKYNTDRIGEKADP